ncbi:MAG TPA: class I SAM-dependent methyltransferase [Anaerolineales bacterium]|nr:class I SAM-dependent methyltransferase [Anaerolineales bacterium]
MSSIVLKPGREKSLLRRHPWVFSGAVQRVDGDIAPGATVEVRSAEGKLLGLAASSPASQIRARLWTFDPDEKVDEAFFRRRIQSALAARAGMQSAPTEACRLVYAESDGLPGLIVDRYADVLVAQFLSAGAEFWRETLADALLELTGLTCLYERSDADVRELEGLPTRVGPLRGRPAEKLVIAENGLQFSVDLAQGHKTGFYLDQRLNRQRVRELAEGRDVLDCFCYTGGFSLNALAGEARSVLSVDASADALALCRENVALNALPADRHQTLEGDVFQLLRKFRDEARSFDLIVLDPPKFAPTAAQAEKAARGYKDINLLGFKLLRPGGLLVTFSCSGGVDAALFQKIVASAALDAGADAQILQHLEQAPDHPVSLHFPEGTYLKGLVCRKA